MYPTWSADVVETLRAKNCNLAARLVVQSGQCAQQSGLAGAVVAEDGVELAAGKFRGDPAQRRETAKLLDQVRDCDDGDGGGFSQWAGFG